jgi:hypothetical protein
MRGNWKKTKQENRGERGGSGTDRDHNAAAGLLAQGQPERLVDLHLDVLGGGPRVHLQQPPPPTAAPGGRPPPVHKRQAMEGTPLLHNSTKPSAMAIIITARMGACLIVWSTHS